MVRIIRANEMLQAEANGALSSAPTPTSGATSGATSTTSGATSGAASTANGGGSGRYDPCRDVSSQTVRFATIISHLYRSLLEKEEEIAVAADMFYVLEIIGLFIGREFYALAMGELLTMIDSALQYNVRPARRAEA